MARLNSCGRGEVDWPGLDASDIATLAGTPATVFGTSYVSGVATTFLRTDDQIKFPAAIMSSANLSTLTLTDDATDQTLTGSLGSLNIRPTAETMSLPKWTSGGATAGSASSATGTVLGFIANSNVIGAALRNGVDATISYADSSTYTSVAFRAIKSEVRTSSTNSPTYTNVTCIGYDQTTANNTLSTNTHIFTKRTGVLVHPSFVLQSGSGVITVTDYFGIEMATWPVIGTPGTVTNARAAHLTMPTIGATIRRGVHLVTATANLGTEAANVEGFYCEDITRGTARRANFYAEGATNSTPTDVYAFFQGTAHVVGTNRYGFRATGATTGTPTLCVGFYADAHAVGTTQWAFYAAGDESYMSGVQQDDNMKDVFGTGRDAELYYDGTDFVCDPDVVGTGSFDIRGAIKVDSVTNDTGLAAGVYTPVRSAEANMDANVTPSEAQYSRVGNTVTVSGRFTADPTLTATATSFELTLPVASNIGAVEDLAGVGFCGAIAGMGAEVTGSVANNTAVVSWVSSDITSKTWAYTYAYQVI